MNDIFKETFGTADTSKQTPIEIALGVDGQGMTTAKKLYAFLEKDVSNYSRWFKKNILSNEFAEKGVDYFPFVTKDECGGQASQDAKLTASFAKKLSMMQKNEKGEAARNYFVGIENGAKKLLEDNMPLKIKQDIPVGEVARLASVMDRIMVRQNSKPHDIARAFEMLCRQFGITLPDNIVNVPHWEQISFDLKN